MPGRAETELRGCTFSPTGNPAGCQAPLWAGREPCISELGGILHRVQKLLH